MERFIALILLGLLAGIAADTALSNVNMFHCQRKGMQCAGNAVCNNEGSCDCKNQALTTVFRRFCFRPNFVPCAVNPCENGGSCSVRNDVDTCHCPDHYAGTTCQYERVHLECDTDSMMIRIHPFWAPQFSGLSYVEGHRTEEDCQLRKLSGHSLRQRIDIGDCGMQQETMNGADGVSVIGYQWSLTVVVQYNEDYVLGTDQELTLTCQYPDTANVSGVVFQTTENNALDAGSGVGQGSPDVSMDLMKDGVTVAVSEEVNVGENLNVHIRFRPSAVYTSFKVDYCSAANSDDTTVENYDSIDIVDAGGCPSDTPVLLGDLSVTTDNGGVVTVTVPLSAFMFVKRASENTNTLFFSCLVKMCYESDVCGPPTGCEKRRRRRRDADDSDVIVGQEIFVRYGTNTQEKNNTESAGVSGSRALSADTARCLRNPDLQTLLSVLGFSLLLLVIFVSVLVYVLCRRRRRLHRHQHGDKFVDDGSSVGSSQQTLSLPRPKF